MESLENVMKALAQCTTIDESCCGRNCPYYVDDGCGCNMLDMKEDALSWLKTLKVANEIPDWRYIKTDGNPEKEGIYDVILIHEEEKLVNPEAHYSEQVWESTGRTFAEIETRWFGEATENDGWLMIDQPKKGLAWHQESGSYMNEYVYAWLPKRDYPVVKLPDGVEWKKTEA